MKHGISIFLMEHKLTKYSIDLSQWILNIAKKYLFRFNELSQHYFTYNWDYDQSNWRFFLFVYDNIYGYTDTPLRKYDEDNLLARLILENGELIDHSYIREITLCSPKDANVHNHIMNYFRTKIFDIPKEYTPDFSNDTDKLYDYEKIFTFKRSLMDEIQKNGTDIY